MKKIALFAFNGDPLCFVHVLLNALDLHQRSHTVRLVLEGTSVKLVPELVRPDHFLHPLWQKVREAGLVDGACRACSVKLGVLEAVEALGLPLLADMSGHAGMAPYLEEGFEVVTF
jgi:hypothetical protein